MFIMERLRNLSSFYKHRWIAGELM
jgi:hypothetical protein